MDIETTPVVKSGKIIVEVGKFLGKSWQLRFCVLHRKTPKEHADLCIYDSSEDFYEKQRKPSRKIVLENVKYLDKSIKSSKGSKECMLEFKCGREKHILKFATESELNEWEYYLRDTVDICSDGQDESSTASLHDPENANSQSEDGVFTENLMYNRTEQAISFDVTVSETEESKRCHLKGHYTIHISISSVGLLDSKQNVVYNWPYAFIRRFGLEAKNNLFVVEAGRKCESGEGHFKFKSRRAQEIHDLVSSRARQMQKTQNPVTMCAPLITQQVAQRKAASISDESEKCSPKLIKKHQSEKSPPKDNAHKSWGGNSNSNNEMDRPSAGSLKHSKKSPDVIPRSHTLGVETRNGSEGDPGRNSLTGAGMHSPSHQGTHLAPDFTKELESKLHISHQTVQQNVKTEENENKAKKIKEKKRDSDKEKKTKEKKKDSDKEKKQWNIFSKKNKDEEKDKSKGKESNQSSLRKDSIQNTGFQTREPGQRFYDEVELPNSPSTGLYSEPFEHSKEKRKSQNRESKDKKALLPTAKKPAHPQDLYSEPIKPEERAVYAEASKREDAWKNYGEGSQFHEEDYMNIKFAREMQEKTSNEPLLPPRAYEDDEEEDDDESYYNRLDFQNKEPTLKTNQGKVVNIYGVASGPVGPLPEQNYESVSSNEEEEEEDDQYAEAADFTPADTYEEAAPQPQLPRPQRKIPQTQLLPESLYEDIK